MGQKPYTDAELRRAWKRYAAAGYCVAEMARRSKAPSTTLAHLIATAERRLGLKVPDELPRAHPKLSEREELRLRRIFDAYVGSGCNQAQVAKQLGIARSSLQQRLHRAELLLGLKAPELTVRDARERQRLSDELTELRREVRRLHREAIEREDYRSTLWGLAKPALDVPEWVAEPPKKHGAPGVPVLWISDVQYGETIRAEEVSGVNAYNADIARQRLELLASKTIELCFGHVPKPDYPGLVVVLGGDLISGEIHQDLERTNDRFAIPAARELSRHLAALLRGLADKFGRIWLVSVPGNHGRDTKKPMAKGYAKNNFDTLIAWTIEDALRAAGDRRFEFFTPESGDACLSIAGYNFVWTHGDRIGSRGGEGFIGPAATISRGMRRVVDNYARFGHAVDYVMVGHFHVALELEHGFSNGSVPGWSQYAMAGRLTPHPPIQWLFAVHPHYGIATRWQVQLAPRMRLPKDAVRPLPGLPARH